VKEALYKCGNERHLRTARPPAADLIRVGLLTFQRAVAGRASGAWQNKLRGLPVVFLSFCVHTTYGDF
jgi:hypothetical protein